MKIGLKVSVLSSESITSAHHVAYGIVPTAHGTPADTLMGRALGEFVRDLITVHVVLKVSALAIA